MEKQEQNLIHIENRNANNTHININIQNVIVGEHLLRRHCNLYQKPH